jgi:hypothetical protein
MTGITLGPNQTGNDRPPSRRSRGNPGQIRRQWLWIGRQGRPQEAQKGSYARAKALPSLRAGEGLLDVEQNLTLVPKTLQIIVGALFRAKEVHDHVTVIEQDPFRFPTPLLAPGNSPELFFDRLEDALLQGLQLPVAAAVAEDKIIRKGIQGTDIQQQDVLPLFLFNEMNDVPREFDWLQSVPPLSNGRLLLSF